MRRRSKKEIDEFVDNYMEHKPKIAECTLGCGQVIEDQVVEHSKHHCVINCCIKWKVKCKNCKKVMSPTGVMLSDKQQIYTEWDIHDRLVKRINQQYGNEDK